MAMPDGMRVVLLRYVRGDVCTMHHHDWQSLRSHSLLTFARILRGAGVCITIRIS